MKKNYRANGKLLLFGEYFILDGSHGLAVPCRYGQELEVTQELAPLPGICWKSYDHKQDNWFEAFFDTSLNLLHTGDDETARTLQKILLSARNLAPAFISTEHYTEAISRLDYPAAWGLGSSSTLIYLVAQWAGVDAMELFFRSFPGSGYDVACAGASNPILYKLSGKKASWNEVDLNWPFAADIYFVYLGKKQNSREGIARYNQRKEHSDVQLLHMDSLVFRALECSDREKMLGIMEESELLVSAMLDLDMAGSFFSDFPGKVKSLGAWGGDFIMALAEDPSFDTRGYFLKKRMDVCFSYPQLVLGK